MVNYTVLKNLVIKACIKTNKFTNFVIDFNKLTKLVEDVGLVPVNSGTCSEKVTQKDIFIISTYLKDRKLKWINEAKEYTILTFVTQDAIDDNCKNLLDLMNQSTTDNPEIDKANIMAEIIADYPCYFVMIVSYKSNEPRRFNQISYEMKCRSNSVMIKKEGYGYKKPEDTEEDNTDQTEEEPSEE